MWTLCYLSSQVFTRLGFLVLRFWFSLLHHGIPQRDRSSILSPSSSLEASLLCVSVWCSLFSVCLLPPPPRWAQNQHFCTEPWLSPCTSFRHPVFLHSFMPVFYWGSVDSTTLHYWNFFARLIELALRPILKVLSLQMRNIVGVDPGSLGHQGLVENSSRTRYLGRFPLCIVYVFVFAFLRQYFCT